MYLVLLVKQYTVWLTSTVLQLCGGLFGDFLKMNQIYLVLKVKVIHPDKTPAVGKNISISISDFREGDKYVKYYLSDSKGRVLFTIPPVVEDKASFNIIVSIPTCILVLIFLCIFIVLWLCSNFLVTKVVFGSIS